MAAQIRIGTSGWHYKHWCGPFYPKKCPSSQWFELYARLFDTVEVNNTFYRLPTEDALRNWHDAAPRKFCFSVKSSRFITHIKRLRDPDDAISLFFSRVELLRSKLGPILFQLPPRWHVDPERLADFLPALPRGHRYVFEFRDESWNTPAIFNLLRRHNCSLYSRLARIAVADGANRRFHVYPVPWHNGKIPRELWRLFAGGLGGSDQGLGNPPFAHLRLLQ